MAENNSIGYDIILDDDGDFQLTNSGDIFSATDDLNIIQAIKNRIITEQGNLIYNTDYGLNYNIIFTKKTPSAIKAIKATIIREISKDPRVKQIVKTEVFTQDDIPELRPDQIYIEIELVPINRNDVIGINFVYPQFISPSITNTIVSESQTSYDRSTVFTNHIIKDVKGIWLATDTNKTGTNYFTGGSFNERQITLGTFLNVNTINLIIDYTTYEVTRNAISVKLIENEEVTTTSNNVLSVDNTIYDVAGIWLFSDSNKDGTNYWFYISGTTYSKGSFNTREITLAQNLPLGTTTFETQATQLQTVGQVQINVADSSGFNPGEYVLIDKGLSTQEYIEIYEIDGYTLKFITPLTQDHSASYSNIEINKNQLIVDYSTSESII